MANLVWHMLAIWEGARVQRRGCGLEGRGSGRNGGEGERACGVRGIIIGREGEGGERGKAREMGRENETDNNSYFYNVAM